MGNNLLRKYIDYDTEMERSVLGIFLLEPASFGSVFNMLTPECFHHMDHENIYTFLVETFNSGYSMDMLTVARRLYDSGVVEIGHLNTYAYLVHLTFDVVSSAHLETWCMILRELAAKRALIAITSNGFDGENVLEAAAGIEKKLKSLMDIRVSDDWEHISKVGNRMQKSMEENTGDKLIGLTTSFANIDNMNGGFKGGQMVVIGARPAVGKSALMGGMAMAIAATGKKVGIMSLEMPSEDNMQRMLSADSLVEFHKIDKNQLHEAADSAAVYGSLHRLNSMPIYFSDKAQVNIHDIRAKAEKLKRKHGLDILFIDYLQLVEPESAKNKNREQEVSQISRGIKLLAMTLKIPVVILAQLNRDAADKEPELYHLRESGSIEQDADIVMFIHRDKDGDTGIMSERSKLLVRKWRNGATMDVNLMFEGETMRFYDPYAYKNAFNGIR